MTYEEALARARLFGFTLTAHAGDKSWFSATKVWDETKQTIAILVYPAKNQFTLKHYHYAIEITTGTLGSFSDDVHFLRWQRAFMETLEKLAEPKNNIKNIGGIPYGEEG